MYSVKIIGRNSFGKSFRYETVSKNVHKHMFVIKKQNSVCFSCSSNKILSHTLHVIAKLQKFKLLKKF